MENSRSGAYNKLPAYTKMIDEKTEVSIFQDVMYATTTIIVEGIIND